MEISVIIPAYNEEANIGHAVDAARSALSRLGGRFEIIVIDDGSSDGTARSAGRLAEVDPRVRLIRLERNEGYGRALLRGFSEASYGHVFFTDADGQFDMEQLPGLVALASVSDIACGFRVGKQYGLLRALSSSGYNFLVRLLFRPGVRDINCAFKLLRKDHALGLRPRASGFFFNAELLTKARRAGLRVAEFPVAHLPRRAGESKVRLRHLFGTLREMAAFILSGTGTDTPRERNPRA